MMLEIFQKGLQECNQDKFITMKLHYFVLLVFFIFSCGSEECKNHPEPIFESEWVQIENYSFEKEERRSTERFLVREIDLGVEINQNVCPSMKQEFQFLIPRNLKDQPDQNWVSLTTSILEKLGSVHINVGLLGDYAKAISQSRDNIVLGEKFALDTNFFVHIDKLIGLDESTLVVSFSEN